VIGRGTVALLMMAAAVPLAGCGEKAQTAGQPAGKKADAKAWEGTQGSAFAAGGWKAGDKESWEAQLKARAEQGQNEYSRSAAAAGETKSP
jgi:hypothetical protein